jgi:hypothetical protein
MTDKHARNNELPALRSAAQERASRHGQMFGAQRGDAPAEQKPLAREDAGTQQDGDEAPVLSDKYDLSLVDEERELRRQARR